MNSNGKAEVVHVRAWRGGTCGEVSHTQLVHGFCPSWLCGLWGVMVMRWKAGNVIPY